MFHRYKQTAILNIIIIIQQNLSTCDPQILLSNFNSHAKLKYIGQNIHNIDSWNDIKGQNSEHIWQLYYFTPLQSQITPFQYQLLYKDWICVCRTKKKNY